MALLLPVLSMPIISLPYYSDSTILFNAIRELPFSCWLDSGKPKSHSGRYDIMSALPSQRWVSKKNATAIHQYQYSKTPLSTQYKEEINHSNESPLALIKAASKALITKEQKKISSSVNALPFSGGIISYFSYDFGREQLSIPQHSQQYCQLADVVAGLYQWAIVQDHEQQRCYLASLNECPQPLIDIVIQHLDQATQAITPTPFSVGAISSNTSYEQYQKKLESINEYIHAGDCYQVNFSQCFSASYKGDPYQAYAHLRHKMASPFSAFMDLGENQAILSLSPERLLSIQQQEALTQPIKGTIARDSIQEIDKANADTLQASIKNRAENLMIVDLLRNDLGKNCIAGSIKVPQLFKLESYPNVHHLVSSITGTIKKEVSALDVFEGCFPGGSITGAPKKRAMEIIEELEECQRSVYCGSIAYINAKGDMDSNITIRTIACDGEKLYCWGGGGIVADSTIEEEYNESLTKINALLEGLALFSTH